MEESSSRARLVGQGVLALALAVPGCPSSHLGDLDVRAADAPTRIDAGAPVDSGGPVWRDASMPTDAAPDAPRASDGGSGGCLGADGLPCLRVGAASSNAPANLGCAASEPAAGTASSRTLRLVAVGTSTSPILGGAFEVWSGNAVGATCAPPDCAMLTSSAIDATVATSLDDGFFAYRVPENPVAMTYRTLGYNRTAAASGVTDIVTLPSALYRTALSLVRSGFMSDPADGFVIGAVSDCDGDDMRGVTIRIFLADGTAVDMSSTAPLEPGLAYRRDGILPSALLSATDYSGGFAAANLPIALAGRIAVVAYGTTDAGGTRDVIGCEEVTIEANAATIIDFGPYRSDYAAGSLCLAHAPAP